MVKKAIWTTKLGEELELIFDENGYFEDFSDEVSEEIRKDFEYFSFPTWEEFDFKWEE